VRQGSGVEEDSGGDQEEVENSFDEEEEVGKEAEGAGEKFVCVGLRGRIRLRAGYPHGCNRDTTQSQNPLPFLDLRAAALTPVEAESS
jgi:hypothetical protein